MDLTLTLIQTDLYWEDKAANLGMLREKIADLKERTQVIVLPEMFSTGFSMQPEKLAESMAGPSLQWMKGLAREKKVILTGSLIVEDQGGYYNRMLWVMPDGRVGYYDKRHLFAYAGEDRQYTAGNRRLIVRVNGWKLLLQVCYDLRFPVWSRQTAGRENDDPSYDILLYPANWPASRAAAWDTLLRARAIENQCYVIGVNRVGTDGNGIRYQGGSSVVGPLGELLYGKTDDEDCFTITLSFEELAGARARYPFLKDADRFDIRL
ncbi:amidohydrolase [Compostibacter hankyongensis]|uniref:Amidohydrolase n=1 Tax=Compostibacter hankyongensis TaxID=1007089 RepID=A0ABP8FDE3_9BACT